MLIEEHIYFENKFMFAGGLRLSEGARAGPKWGQFLEIYTLWVWSLLFGMISL